MELSPKQQAVNEIKNAKRILILGHKKPDGDHLGSLLALKIALEKIEKSVEIVVSDKVDSLFTFLPRLDEAKKDYKHTEGKILKIDTTRIPISGMKWQKDEDSLNIFLDTDKNLKFEFIEIINGLPKPDLIIVVDTADVQKIDNVYDQNTELFYEVPILNIDHHPGNEYFGTINLIDLTATSTAEILVSLFEALGIKIDNPDIATCLLAGILYDTQSFRGQNTTPKSLTVAAQLLAAGGRQQEIITNYYNKKPVELLKVWNEMLANLKEDQNQKFAWTVIDTANSSSLTKEDVLGGAEDLLANTPSAEIIMVLFKGAEDPETVYGRLLSKDKEVLSMAKLFGGMGGSFDASFSIKESNLEFATNLVLKKLAESWSTAKDTDKKELWDVIEQNENVIIETKTEQPAIIKKDSVRLPDEEQTVIDIPNSVREKEDAIEEALKSISQVEKDVNRREMESLRDVIDRKKQTLPASIDEVDVFEEE